MERFTNHHLVLRALKKAHILKRVVTRLVFSPPKRSSYFLNEEGGHIFVAKHGDLNKTMGSAGFKLQWNFTPNGLFVLVAFPVHLESVAECDRVLLFSHGTSVDVGLSVNEAVKVTKLMGVNAGVVLWDYPGYGLSSGKPTEKGLYRGILEVYDLICGEYSVSGSCVVAAGYSIGSVPTVYLGTSAKDRELMAMILISPIASAYQVARHHKQDDPIGMFSNVDTIRNGLCPWPVFVAHGTEDSLVTVEDCDLLVKTLRETPSGNTSDLKDSCSSFASFIESDPDNYEEAWRARVSYCPVVGAGHGNVTNNKSFQTSALSFINAL